MPLDTILGIWESPLMVSIMAGNAICLVFFRIFSSIIKFGKCRCANLALIPAFNGRYSYRGINKISNSRLSTSTSTPTESTPTIVSFCTDG